MKKIIFVLLVFFLLVTICSCKKPNEGKAESPVKTDKVGKVSESKIDLDLSTMNYNMMSSITFDIMVSPENYVGKRIKTAGSFYTSVYEGQRYYSVLIWDPTGCCPAGFDFVPPEGMNYPEDFPENDDSIVVTGILKYIEVDGQNYLAFQAEEIVKEI